MSDAVLPKKLNVGCGYDKRTGYLNIDVDPACQPDLLIVDNDLSALPKGHFEEVLALDVLEHIPRLHTLGALLEWADLLVDGGSLILQTSSITGVAEQLEKNADSFREQFGWTLCLFGSQAHPGDFHYTGFTEMSLQVQLLAAGFDVNRMWITDHWLLHAEATKSHSWTSVLRDAGSVDDREFIGLLYQQTLGRDPEPSSVDYLAGELASGALDRRAVAKHVSSSTERLFVVAHRHGFERPPRAITAERVARRIPEPLKPALRWTRSTARTASSRTRRAVGIVEASPAAVLTRSPTPSRSSASRPAGGSPNSTRTPGRSLLTQHSPARMPSSNEIGMPS